ncbi:5113_t:CDS:2, partial [Cetraspora pellucida]
MAFPVMNEVRVNQQPIIQTQEHITILGLDVNKEAGGIMANLSDSR